MLIAEALEYVKQILIDMKEEMGIRRTIAGDFNIPSTNEWVDQQDKSF